VAALSFVIAGALVLSGCASTGERVLTNLQGCERHYNGVVSGGILAGSFSGSVKIDCTPATAGPETPPATPPADPG